MPLPLDAEANESRTQSVGVKRNLVASQEAQEDAPSLPPNKKQKSDKQPTSIKQRRQAQSLGEKYGFESAEYKFQLLGRRRRKKIPKQRELAGLPLLPHFHDTAQDKWKQAANMSTPVTQDQAGPLAWNKGSAGTIRTSLRGKIAVAPESQLGKNRLATGFASGSAAAAPSPESLESGETHSTPIEISSDEEEGGLLINVEGQDSPEVINVDSDSDEDEEDDDNDQEMEDGEWDEQAVMLTSVSSPNAGDADAHIQLQVELERHLSNGFQPLSTNTAVNKKRAIRLADLLTTELEMQYKYCFYGLRRDQIDLSRPAICTECLQEGHTDAMCTEKYCHRCGNAQSHSSRQCPKYRRCTKCRERGHDAAVCQSKLKHAVVCEICGSSHHIESDCSLRFFPSIDPICNAAIKLWISCCNCASKTHLVGDCPTLHPDKAPRWSLRRYDAQQISNLSLQTGIRGLEKAAENRNMRPQGRDIRPAKQKAPVNQRKTFDDNSEDEQDSFLRPPIQRQTQRSNIVFAQPAPNRSQRFQFGNPQSRSPDRGDRYDRYDASSAPNNRSRGDWYQSDSFGLRRRSRSPESGYNARRDVGDSYRPYDQGSPQRRPTSKSSLGDRIQYPQDRGPPGQDRGWQPPLPREAPPGDTYRPGERLLARPSKSSYQRGKSQHGGYR